MKKRSLLILFLLAWILTANIHAEINYIQSGDLYHHAMSGENPAQEKLFQSSSYYNNNYTIPFAADKIEIGGGSPYIGTSPSNISGRRNAGELPPGFWIDPEDTPEGPSIVPLSEGMWFMLLCIFGYCIKLVIEQLRSTVRKYRLCLLLKKNKLKR